MTALSNRLASRIRRPIEVTELIRCLNPDVPYRDFEQARGVEELEAILRYIYALESNQV